MTPDNTYPISYIILSFTPNHFTDYHVRTDNVYYLWDSIHHVGLDNTDTYYVSLCQTTPIYYTFRPEIACPLFFIGQPDNSSPLTALHRSMYIVDRDPWHDSTVSNIHIHLDNADPRR